MWQIYIPVECLPFIRLVKCIHQEYTCIHIGYVYTHEHDFVLAHEPIENGKQILTCSTCNLLYCEKCGKELSITHNGLEAKSKKFRHLWAPKYNTASDRLNCHDLSAPKGWGRLFSFSGYCRGWY